MFGDVWKQSNWLDAIAIPFTTAMMRVAWVYPFLLILTEPAISGSTGIHIPAWLLFVLSFGSTLLANLASESREGYLVAILTGFSACFAVLLVTFPPSEGLFAWFSWLGQRLVRWENSLPAPAVLFVATGLLWWRGMATRVMEHTQFTLSFATGGFMMVVLLLLTRILPPVMPGATLVASMLVYLVAGLGTLALAGASQALRRNAYQSGISLQLSRHWLLAVAVVIGGVLVIGWLLGLLVVPESVLAVMAWLKPIWRLLGRIVYYLLYPIIYLLFLLLQPLFDWFQGLFSEEQATVTPTPVPQETLEPLEEMAREIPPAVNYSLRGVIAVAIIALFVFLFIRALRKYKPRRRPQIEETRERILTWDLLRDQISSLLRNARRVLPPPLFYPLVGEITDPRRVIREAYRRLLTLALRRGTPRAERDTPYAYRDKLAEIAPGHEAAIQTITDAYVTARYNEELPTIEQAADATRAIEEIESGVPGATAASTNS